MGITNKIDEYLVNEAKIDPALNVFKKAVKNLIIAVEKKYPKTDIFADEQFRGETIASLIALNMELPGYVKKYLTLKTNF
jgi:hypothetical protein